MNRRTFLLGLMIPPQAGRTAVQAEVLEVFRNPGGPSALLVHHARESEREAFGKWLRENSGRRIALRLPDGTGLDGWIFRVKMCFGRGLILTRAPVRTDPKAILRMQ
jgi:hypothetical protein